jgi:hypothetical protein
LRDQPLQRRFGRGEIDGGLSWYWKARQSKSRMIPANSLAPEPLRVPGLDAQQADAAAQANWKTAVSLTRLAEQPLSEAMR